MTELFITLLHMSMTASIAAAAVIIIRVFLRRSGPVSPLAFGESSIKARIKNILKLTTPSFFITILITVLTAAFIIGFVTNPIRGSRGYNNQEYDIDKMLAGKTAYVGNNAKVVALIDAMPFPVGLVRESVELHTGTRPFGITINMDMREVSGILENGAISGRALFPNSVMLFSLIDNVDTIKYRLSDNTGKYDGASYGFTFTRSMPEKLLGEDVRSYSADGELLQKLLDRVTKMRVGVQKDSDSIPAGSQMKSTEYEDKEIAGEIEQYLRVITAPGSSSSPEDYIRAHGKEYDSILKLRSGALDYFLLQFKENRVENDLRGHIIMSLCKELLGDRNNVNDPAILPTKWYSELKPYEEISLGDYKAQATDPVEQLVYVAAVTRYSNPQLGFTVVAPTIFGSYEEKDKLKVFVTVYTGCYKLYENTVTEEGGSIVPAAITFKKNTDGSYTLEQYTEAKDGSLFAPSINGFCTMPVSGKQIEGLADKIIKDYSDHSSRQELLVHNLIEHLNANQISDISLKQVNGKLLPLT